MGYQRVEYIDETLTHYFVANDGEKKMLLLPLPNNSISLSLQTILDVVRDEFPKTPISELGLHRVSAGWIYPVGNCPEALFIFIAK